MLENLCQVRPGQAVLGQDNILNMVVTF